MQHVKIFDKIGIMEFNPLRNLPEVTHCFTTRESGNMGLHVAATKSKLIKTVENRLMVCRTFAINFNFLVTAQQVHGDRIVPVNPGMRGLGHREYSEALPNCDGLITNYDGVPLAIFVADCLPLYIYDPRKKVIGLIHAGRAGTQMEIARKAIEMMETEYETSPRDCLAILGPAIGPCCLGIDLYDLNRRQLYQAGVSQEKVYSVDTCTSCQSELFYSYHREKEKAGRMMALFMLK